MIAAAERSKNLKPMRILHVIPYMDPRAGGPPVVVEQFVRESNKLGHASRIISTPQFCDGNSSALVASLNEIAPTIFVPRSAIRTALSPKAKRHITACIAEVDLVHVHTLWSPINVLVRRECNRQGRPYVLMPHGMLDPYSLSINRRRKALYLWLVERKNIISAERIVYTTSEEARLASGAKFDLPKAAIVSLGANAPVKSHGTACGFLEHFPKARNRRQLLFLGRLHWKKGIDHILAVLPSIIKPFPNVLLTIVGAGDPQFTEAIKRLVSSQGLEHHVLLTGMLEGALKWGAYASAEVFLLPSRQENFAITVAEAMQMGLPVIISNRVNTWPYVREAGAGLILDEGSMQRGLEKGLLSLLANPNAAKTMGEAGYTYSRKHLTWQGAADCLIRCYDEALEAFAAKKYASTSNGTPLR